MFEGITVSSTFLLIVAIVCSGYMARIGIKKNRKIFTVLSLVPIVLLFGYITKQSETAIEDKQIEMAIAELTERYHFDNLWIEPIAESTDDRNQYTVETENGNYQVAFNPESWTGFEVNHLSGENLRGRKNVFDVLKLAGVYSSNTELTVSYMNDASYEIKVNEDTLTVRLIDHVVDVIENEEGISVYVNQDSQ